MLSSAGAYICEQVTGTDGSGEARRAEKGVWVLGEEAASTYRVPPHHLGVWRRAVSSPSGIWRGASADIDFDSY